MPGMSPLPQGLLTIIFSGRISFHVIVHSPMARGRLPTPKAKCNGNASGIV